ncbi:hypothetical protein CcaverHIS002_0309900 [Cutaneotrichosporon cavernicola]|uniref:PEBP-like protein n=1 Tax=Cutaneotrichosporon cavernicola TaxID=279322 RepID=A0AA48L279_9TREE|nr:uncharacterized protein CcaverHIS019_0309750 [Cutaneotrichosporon cavernicola]BEI83122.1 hypothetical protein CcaverHIS002_0309900 [Cutaneotrichosporon cavernicola]BEI90905.1 hypothetical protein CcaverHIS019_0309750 [Cutaneotrichosporon cavernicola]BEI98684.1 hypothetical protein CcaverHIS631_0309830 [Cutaneotrichosporon cavernicola]BEJ06454.1 hypothetical protein CcaverHIS641_0309760 [Cutaneotrichosporon cavernicola]
MFPLFLLATAASAATTTDLAYVAANFENAGLGSVFPSFAPEAVLDASFGSSKVAIGQPVTQDTAGTRPELTVDAGDAFDASGNYSLLLVDANIVGWADSQNLHWLTNGVTLSGNGTSTPDYTAATDIRSYAGPGPAAGSGAHRYVLLMYRQPAQFTAPEGFSATIEDVIPFKVGDYATAAGLDLVAANYFTVENGVASVSVAQTTSVDPATLSVASSSASSSAAASSGAASSGSAAASGSQSQSASKSAASGSPSAPASTNTSGTGKTVPSLFALVAGAVLALF